MGNTIHTIKNRTKDQQIMKILVVDDENHQTAMKLGADDFLTKPLDFAVLKEKLKSIEL